MADYEKFASRVMDEAQKQGVDTSDPDAVEPIAKAVAERFVLDEATLVELVRQRAAETEQIGTIDQDRLDPDETEPSVLLDRAEEWAEETDHSAAEVDWAELVAGIQNIDSKESDHDFTAWRRDSQIGEDSAVDDDS
jgi:hypothetical protein